MSDTETVRDLIERRTRIAQRTRTLDQRRTVVVVQLLSRPPLAISTTGFGKFGQIFRCAILHT
jgi:hypothetical protein